MSSFLFSAHTQLHEALPPIHNDLFDRLLVAQSLVEGIVLLTSDATVAQYGGSIRIVWRCKEPSGLRCGTVEPTLQRPNLHLPPLDRATGCILRAVTELQREGAAGEFAVLYVYRLHAVKNDCHARALGCD